MNTPKQVFDDAKQILLEWYVLTAKDEQLQARTCTDTKTAERTGQFL